MGEACSTLGRDKCVKKFWSENLKRKDNSLDLDVDGKILLGHILEKWVGRCGLDSSGSG
jgi:hypothetical protein